MPHENGQTPKDLYLADLRDQIARLQALIAAVESGGEVMTGGNGTASTVRGGETVRPDSFFGMSIPQATKRYLEMMGKGNPQSPTAIADALKKGGIDQSDAALLKNVYTAFLRGKNDPFIKVGKLWGLVDWYGPNAVAAANAADGDKKAKKKKGKKPKAFAAAKGAPSQNKNPWNAFAAEYIRAGKTMAEAAEAWKKKKAEG